jgi:hypothetical protein
VGWRGDVGGAGCNVSNNPKTPKMVQVVEDRKARESSLKPYVGYLYPKATLNPMSFGLCALERHRYFRV